MTTEGAWAVSFSDNGITERISVLNTKWRATQNKAARTIWQMKIVIQMWLHETATWWCDKHLCCFLNQVTH